MRGSRVRSSSQLRVEGLVVTREELAREIFGRRAAHYTTSGAHTDAEGLARFVDWVAPRPQWFALDIATGTGHTAFALAPHVAGVVAVDLTTRMLREAQSLRAAADHANVLLAAADAHALPCAMRPSTL